MINQSNFFDLGDVIVNELVGDVWLTVIVGLILTLYLSIKAKMPMQVTILLSALWLLVMFAGYTVGLWIIWVYLVLFIGVLYYYIISKAFKRG